MKLPPDAYAYPTLGRRLVRGVCALSVNSFRVLLRRGASSTEEFITNCHRLYAGYSLPSSWAKLPWRDNLRLAQRNIEELFPEIDFTQCPPLAFPLHRDLGISTEELAILAKVVHHLRPRRVVEFGTAEGRTTVNLASHLPDDGEIVTLDFHPIKGSNEVGYFYWEHPAKARISQVFCSVIDWDSRPFQRSAEMVFADACDLMPGLAAEFFHAMTVLKPGGLIFRHDYGSAIGVTHFWNWIAERVPAFHVAGTTLVCLRLNSEKVFQEAQGLLSHPLIKNSVRTLR